MNKLISMYAGMILFAACASGLLYATENETQSEQGKARIVYQPPLLGAPSSRVGAASKSMEQMAQTSDVNKEELTIIAPRDHLAIVLLASPSIYWYQGAYSEEVNILVVEAVSAKSLLHTRRTDVQEGLNLINLADYQIELIENREYCISLYLSPTPDPDNAHDTRCFIRIPNIGHMVMPPGKPSMESIKVLAESGFWYGAFAELSTLIDISSNSELIDVRRDLLLQIELEYIAKLIDL